MEPSLPAPIVYSSGIEAHFIRHVGSRTAKGKDFFLFRQYLRDENRPVDTGRLATIFVRNKNQPAPSRRYEGWTRSNGSSYKTQCKPPFPHLVSAKNYFGRSIVIAGRYEDFPRAAMVIRYDKRLEDEELWQVYEIKTGHIVMIAGRPYDGLAKHEADEIVNLLETGAIIADTDPEAPAGT
jgi:hypothetical protein